MSLDILKKHCRFMGPRLFFAIGTLAALSSAVSADEVDDLLAKRHANVVHIKKIHADTTIETSQTAADGTPGRKLKFTYGYTVTTRNRSDRDPLKRFDADIEVTTPRHIHFRVENGQCSYQNAAGTWVSRDL